MLVHLVNSWRASISFLVDILYSFQHLKIVNCTLFSDVFWHLFKVPWQSKDACNGMSSASLCINWINSESFRLEHLPLLLILWCHPSASLLVLIALPKEDQTFGNYIGFLIQFFSIYCIQGRSSGGAKAFLARKTFSILSCGSRWRHWISRTKLVMFLSARFSLDSFSFFKCLWKFWFRWNAHSAVYDVDVWKLLFYFRCPPLYSNPHCFFKIRNYVSETVWSFHPSFKCF